MIAADVEGQVTPNQWLKRPLLSGPSIERSGKQREIRGKIVSTEYIVSIVSIPYAPELHLRKRSSRGNSS
jgi:hypothetical protein